MTPLDAALQWNNLGIAAIPIKYRDKRPNFRSFKKTGDVDKHGHIAWNPYKKTMPEIERVKTWFESKYTNLAIITGWKNLVIIDFDNESIWKLWESWIGLQMPELLPHTYRVITRRGQHVYLFIENPPERTLKIQTDEENPRDRKTLIDIKAAGGYCLAPPSIHPSGHRYQAINEPKDIMIVKSLECVLPCMLLEKATSDNVAIPVQKPVTTDIWSITPATNENSIKWIKQNRSILEFFPNALPSGGDRWYKVLCPFHDDHSESGWIDVRRNRFGCQNQCVGRGIDVIDFYCLLKNVDRSQAVRELTA